MTHTYHIDGMTCSGCQAKVQGLLSKVKGIDRVSIDLNKEEALLEMSRHIPVTDLQEALKEYPKYQLSAPVSKPNPKEFIVAEEARKSWLATYFPIILVFGYILGITLTIDLFNGPFFWMPWMNHFMAGFFLIFSFFKLLNLEGFADSYSMYDIIAKKWKGWGYVYPFVELGLGMSFLSGFHPVFTNTATFILMSVSLVGVLQSVLNKRKIKCACLGAIFDLPMSTLTIIEDTMMIGMSVTMLLLLF